MSTTKKIEKKNEKRMTKAAVANGCTLAAQLKAMWHDHEKELSSTNADGKVTAYGVTKMEHMASLGLLPHYVGKGEKKKCVGYTPAEFNNGVDEELLLKNDSGKVMATYVYRERVVNVEILEEGEDGKNVYPLFTKDEAEKKAKGESGAKSIKVYRKIMIDEFGWGQKLIADVLTQSRNIVSEMKKAEKSIEDYNAIEEVYIVKNEDGVNKVYQVTKPELDF